MSEKKSSGFLNQVFANAETWRGQCEGYARRDLAGELAAAQAREARTKYAFDDAAVALATKDSSNKIIYIVAGCGLAALALYLLLA